MYFIFRPERLTPEGVSKFPIAVAKIEDAIPISTIVEGIDTICKVPTQAKANDQL